MTRSGKALVIAGFALTGLAVLVVAARRRRD
jgi:LPXTG-motif cell wall-anchored protein